MEDNGILELLSAFKHIFDYPVGAVAAVEVRDCCSLDHAIHLCIYIYIHTYIHLELDVVVCKLSEIFI